MAETTGFEPPQTPAAIADPEAAIRRAQQTADCARPRESARGFVVSLFARTRSSRPLVVAAQQSPAESMAKVTTGPLSRGRWKVSNCPARQHCKTCRRLSGPLVPIQTSPDAVGSSAFTWLPAVPFELTPKPFSALSLSVTAPSFQWNKPLY